MELDEQELRYLRTRALGRLATLAPNGTPQLKPVGYRYNSELGTIDITGFAMAASAKYRNVQRNPDVAFVVDDVVGEGSEGVRFLEIRGRAEAVVDESVADGHLSAEVIRIHPRRVVGYNLDGIRPVLHTRAGEA